MREIKFRCWDEKLKRWEYWGLPEDAGYIAGRFNKENATKKGRRFSTKTLCQFTGLHDKNGEEIYEGDIVECDDKGSKSLHEVRFTSEKCDESRFGWDSVGWYENEIEVIGNIYENPELIKTI